MYNKDGKFLADVRVCECSHLEIHHYAKGYDGACCHIDHKYHEDGTLILPLIEIRCQCKKFVHCRAFDKDTDVPTV